MVLHDIYFYTTHRLMHLAPLFKAVHAGHHRSITPTALGDFVVPTIGNHFSVRLLRPGDFLPASTSGDIARLFAVSTASSTPPGTAGYELVAPASQKHWLLKYLNAVTHHDLHHTRFRYNFGQYFNIWDRLFGTFLDRPAA